MMAWSTISILPTAILMVALRKHIIEGMSNPDLSAAKASVAVPATLYSTDRRQR